MTAGRVGVFHPSPRGHRQRARCQTGNQLLSSRYRKPSFGLSANFSVSEGAARQGRHGEGPRSAWAGPRADPFQAEGALSKTDEGKGGRELGRLCERNVVLRMCVKQVTQAKFRYLREFLRQRRCGSAREARRGTTQRVGRTPGGPFPSERRTIKGRRRKEWS